MAFIGHPHHGKTPSVDCSSRRRTWSTTSASSCPANSKRRKKVRHSLHAMLRYTDPCKDEQQRGLSIKACHISLVLPDPHGKHWLINCLDVPGHVNSSDELTAILRLVDGAVVMDCAEGVPLGTRRAMKHAPTQRISMVVVLKNRRAIGHGNRRC